MPSMASVHSTSNASRTGAAEYLRHGLWIPEERHVIPTALPVLFMVSRGAVQNGSDHTTFDPKAGRLRPYMDGRCRTDGPSDASSRAI